MTRAALFTLSLAGLAGCVENGGIGPMPYGFEAAPRPLPPYVAEAKREDIPASHILRARGCYYIYWAPGVESSISPLVDVNNIAQICDPQPPA